MNSHIRVAVALLVVIGSLAGPSIAAFHQDVAMRYRWNKGETLRYRATQQSTTTMSGLPGGMGDMNVEQTMTHILKAVVQDIAADGTTTLQQQLESVKLEITSPMGTMTYDSASPDPGGNPAMAAMLSTMVGEAFTVTLAPTGTVQKVEGFSRILEKLAKNVPQDPRGAAILSSLKGTFTDETMLNMMGQGFTQFPDRALKIGESWTNQISISNPMMGALTMSMTSTLKAVDGSGADQVARIATQMTITPDPAAPPAPNPLGLSVKMGESTGEGESLFDVARGRLLRSTMRSAMPMSMSGPGPDGTPLSMKSNVKATMILELVQQ